MISTWTKLCLEKIRIRFWCQSRHQKLNYAEYSDTFDNLPAGQAGAERQQKISEFFKFNLSTYLLQRYKFYPAILLFTLLIPQITACGSSRAARIDTETTVRSTVTAYIKALNEEDIKTLEILYADDFMSYAPVYKSSKAQLLKDLQNGFNQQNNSIKARIMEINSGTILATVQLQWMIRNEKQEIIFAQNLLQLWKKEQTGWKLGRILFYVASEVPELEDFDF